MPRYRLTVAYEGTDFHGWQKQHPPGEEPLRTAQGELEKVVQAVVREPVHVLGASRTDSGVHARGQVASFSTSNAIPIDRVVPALNARLPDDIQVRDATIVPESFNPIGDAVRKTYRYRIAFGGPRTTRKPLFDRRLVSFTPHVLDVEAMDAAARDLVGEHDFASFTRVNHNRESTVRRIDACSVAATSRRRLRIEVTGNGFLYNMVRIIAGTLVDVGRGRLGRDAIPGIIAATDRAAAGPTLPPEGLCLMNIEYPPDVS